MIEQKVVFSFPLLSSAPEDVANVVLVGETEKRILMNSGGGIKELTRKELLNKISEYEEAAAMTKAALSLLR
jgi:hypothetical protein